MRGYIQKRGKSSWRIEITVGTLPNGKPDRIRETVRGKKEVAEARLAELLVELNRNEHVRPSETTFEEVYEKWLKASRISWEPNTLKFYEDTMGGYLIPKLGDMKITDIDLDVIEDWYADLHNDKIGPTTIRDINGTITSLSKYAIRRKYIKSPPNTGVKLPKRKDQRITLDDYWTQEEIGSFLKAIEEEQYKMYYVLVLSTGLRVNEARALRWENVDLPKKKILVCEAIKQEPNAKKGKEMIVGPPKSAAGYRTVKISKELVQELKTHKAKQNEAKLKAGDLYESNDFVIANEFGQLVNRRHLGQKVMKRCIKKAGVKQIPLKNLRHTHATTLLSLGVDMRTLQERLGHQDYAITANIYAHAAESLQKDAAEKSGAILRLVPQLFPKGAPDQDSAPEQEVHQ